VAHPATVWRQEEPSLLEEVREDESMSEDHREVKAHSGNGPVSTAALALAQVRRYILSDAR
jgi:hypothetical protein